MSSSKPNPEIRKPPSDDETDADKVAAFISGDDDEGDGTATTDGDVDPDAPGIVELEDGTLKRRMTVYLDPEDGKAVKMLAALENRKISDVLAEAVGAYLEDRELPEF
jgi:hypothetical protein